MERQNQQLIEAHAAQVETESETHTLAVEQHTRLVAGHNSLRQTVALIAFDLPVHYKIQA